MTNPEVFTYTTAEGFTLHAYLYRSLQPAQAAIIYFHGGGLLYGTALDLPDAHRNQLRQAGYDFWALEYPLAPEARLSAISAAAHELLEYCLDQHRAIYAGKLPYVLFGRSAGAYLALVLCQQQLQQQKALPAALVSLYGYAALAEPAFTTPSPYYQKLPAVPSAQLKKLLSPVPLTSAPLSQRFSLYVSARQQGSWVHLLCGPESPGDFSVTAPNLAQFPPAFLAAAASDPDVPYKMSKQLSRQIPGSRLITLYREDHDFDRDAADPEGQQVYQDMITWLAGIL